MVVEEVLTSREEKVKPVVQCAFLLARQNLASQELCRFVPENRQVEVVVV
jgi:hypothetical protein